MPFNRLHIRSILQELTQPLIPHVTCQFLVLKGSHFYQNILKVELFLKRNHSEKGLRKLCKIIPVWGKYDQGNATTNDQFFFFWIFWLSLLWYNCIGFFSRKKSDKQCRRKEKKEEQRKLVKKDLYSHFLHQIDFCTLKQSSVNQQK